MKENKFVQREQVSKVERVVTESVTLDPWDRVVLVDAGADAITITLANVSEAREVDVSIRIRTAGGGVVTVAAGADAAVAYSETIEDEGDFIYLKSDGLMWIELAKKEAD